MMLDQERQEILHCAFPSVTEASEAGWAKIKNAGIGLTAFSECRVLQRAFYVRARTNSEEGKGRAPRLANFSAMILKLIERCAMAYAAE
jgi:hypothetical protein